MTHHSAKKLYTDFCGRLAGLIAVSATLGVLCLGITDSAYAQAPSGMHQTWSEEFAGAATSAQPNSATWAYDLGGGGWGNNELETYVNSAANCHMVYDSTGTDGQALQIEAQKDSSGKWYSARIKTQGKISFGPYGYFETRCKFPNAGAGYWPASWMLGTNISSVGWPKCGEIDVAEEKNAESTNHQSLHAPNWNPTVSVSASNAATTYHNYGVNWQPTYVTFYQDGKATATFTSSSAPSGGWVFNGTDFLIVNLAIGGNFPGSPNSSTKANGNFDIDYIRVFEY